MLTLRNLLAIAVRQKSMAMGTTEESIRKKLTEALNPNHLDILNESYMHNVPKGSETHFKVVVVSSSFDGVTLIQRHRIVNKILDEELKSGVHALSIVAKSPSQWTPEEQARLASEATPKCRGGFGK